MNKRARPDPILLADHPALDFLNSRAVPVDLEVEWIGDGDGLIAWLVAAGMIDTKEAAECRRRFTSTELDETAAEARKLREWLRGFVRGRAGGLVRRQLNEKALWPLNRLLGEGNSFWRVEAGAGKSAVPALVRYRRWTEARQLLQPIADAIGDLITRADFRLIRACEGRSCTVMFLDRTKSHQRRWCSMAICGNRAKAAGFRERMREG